MPGGLCHLCNMTMCSKTLFRSLAQQGKGKGTAACETHPSIRALCPSFSVSSGVEPGTQRGHIAVPAVAPCILCCRMGASPRNPLVTTQDKQAGQLCEDTAEITWSLESAGTLRGSVGHVDEFSLSLHPKSTLRVRAVPRLIEYLPGKH